MHKFLWALGLTIVSSIGLSLPFALAQVTENFSDGDLSTDPGWSGQPDLFTVYEHQLQLTAPPGNGSAYLSTATQISQGRWEFYVHLDFNPSDANYVRIYLISDHENLAGSLNGYFVMIGGAADEISLYRQSDLSKTKIIDGTDDVTDLQKVEVTIRVHRSSTGEWQLFHTANGGSSFELAGSVTDLTYLHGGHFGFYCEYTTTRSDKFFFDNVVVEGTSGLPSGSGPANYKEIIFSEFMADPTPAIGMPDSEFVEIFNRTSTTFNLSGYSISDGNSVGTLPSFDLPGGEHAVIVPAQSIELFETVPNTLSVSGFPSINNSGDLLILRNAEGTLLDSLNFTDAWYRDAGKKTGGWSLEIIDPANTCGEEDNWSATVADNGGTPGLQNSVFSNKPDVTGPNLVAAYVLGDDLVRMDFDEKLLLETIDASQVVIQPQTTVAEVRFLDSSLRSLLVELADTLLAGTPYQITVSQIRDCNKNQSPDQGPLVFALPEVADSLDVVVNEVLFNPFAGGSDFVELMNQSEKYLDLAGWKIGRWDANGNVEETRIITMEHLLLAPGGILAFTPDRDDVLNRYSQAEAQAIYFSQLPSMPDESGSVVIVDAGGKVLDALEYSEDFHSALVVNDEGVSLERIHTTAPTQDPQNWKSASGDSGFATPGGPNSNAPGDLDFAVEPVYVEPEIFQPVYGSPNYATISYRFEQGGGVATVRILDPQGRQVKELAVNNLLGTNGFLRWDGDTDDGTKARIGYYVVWFQVFDLEGSVRTFKKRVVVAAPF